MSRELLSKALAELDNADSFGLPGLKPLIDEIQDELAKPEPKFFVIDWPDYHYEGMGCGLEDRNITDRYEAMRYGWDCALDRVAEVLPDKIYTHPPAQQKPLSDDDIKQISDIYMSMFNNNFDMYIHESEVIEFARDIERKVRGE